MNVDMLQIFEYPQPVTPNKIHNAMVAQFIPDTIKDKQTRACEVQYHWSSNNSEMAHQN